MCAVPMSPRQAWPHPFTYFPFRIRQRNLLDIFLILLVRCNCVIIFCSKIYKKTISRLVGKVTTLESVISRQTLELSPFSTSGLQTILKLSSWACGTDPLTLEQKRARAHQNDDYILKNWFSGKVAHVLPSRNRLGYSPGCNPSSPWMACRGILWRFHL